MSITYKIAFGTDGWRGVIGDDFVFANVRRVAAAIAAYVRAEGEPDRGLVIVADEAIADNCADQVKYTWVVDVREPTNPVTISTFPTPAEEDYCARGGHFGPHNLHENRPGSFQSSELIFATYQNAGVRVFDIKNPFRPEEVAYFVPPPPERMFDTRPGRARVIQSCDVFVEREGLMYVTDYNAGLYILEYKG